MSSDKTKKWIKAAAVRAVKTMAQTAVSLITVGNLDGDGDEHVHVYDHDDVRVLNEHRHKFP